MSAGRGTPLPRPLPHRRLRHVVPPSSNPGSAPDPPPPVVIFEQFKHCTGAYLPVTRQKLSRTYVQPFLLKYPGFLARMFFDFSYAVHVAILSNGADSRSQTKVGVRPKPIVHLFSSHFPAPCVMHESQLLPHAVHTHRRQHASPS